MAAALSLLALAASASASTTAFTTERFALATAAPALLAQTLPPAQHVVNLTGKAPRPSYKAAALRSLRKKTATSNYTDVLNGSDGDEEYLTPITIGGQNFQVIVDTGSSDTWLAQKGFQCFNLTSYPEPSSECGFGTAGFNPSKSKTFKAYPNHNFNISYGDGEFLTGTVGFDTVTVGGLAVTQQEIGVVTKAAWNGDGVNTGLMGLAFASLTSVFKGNNPDNDSFSDPDNQEPYSPFFLSAIKQGKVKQPIFSLALDRGSFANEANSTVDKNLGYLAFGGIAPVPVTSTSATVPIQGYTVKGSKTPLYEFYTVDVAAITFPGSKNVSTKIAPILDSGTTLAYLPDDVAAAYNAQWKPAATFDADQDIYFVSCNATAPPMSVTIGSATFTVDPRDNILPSTNPDGSITCISGTQPGGPNTDGNIFILGDVFLHNVVATFNLQQNTTTLTQRQKY